MEHQQIHATVTSIAPGHRFTLYNAPFISDNGDYLTIAARYEFKDNTYVSGGEGDDIQD